MESLSSYFHIGFAVCAAIFAVCSLSFAGGPKEKDYKKEIAEAKKLFENKDSYAAFNYLESLGNPGDTINSSFAFVGELYYKDKNHPRMIMAGRAAIDYCLGRAKKLEKDEPDKAKNLRMAAMSIAYNVSANLWPGWQVEDAGINSTDLAFGLDLAKLNKRIATELELPPIKISHGCWIVGAHYLAAGNYKAAVSEFETAKEKAAEDNMADSVAMCEGYIAISLIADGGKTDGIKRFDAAVEDLMDIDTEDSRFYADQLKTARKVFRK